MAKKSGKQRRRSAGRQWIGLGALAVILIAAAIFASLRSRVQPLDATRLASDPTIGPKAASVTIVEYGDFGCPTCRGWERAGVRNQLVSTYGDKIQFVWKDFPVITAESPKAAEAGQCAFDQGKFWEYHDLLYEKAPALSVAELKDYAAQLGLDTLKFNRCLDSGQDAAKVQQGLDEAEKQYGFPGTPSFLVNGKKLVGPASFDTFRSLIDPLLGGG